MKFVVQFFNPNHGTRSPAFTGDKSYIISVIERLEDSLNQEIVRLRDMLKNPILPVGEVSPEDVRSELELKLKHAEESLDRFVDSYVIVILEQDSDDPEDMKVSQIPILKRENFVQVLKEKK